MTTEVGRATADGAEDESRSTLGSVDALPAAGSDAALTAPDAPAAPVDFGLDGLDRRLRDAAPRDHRGLVGAGILAVDVVALLVPSVLQRDVSPAVLTYVAVALVLLGAGGAYRPRISLSALDEAPRFASRLGVALLLVGALTLATDPDATLLVDALLSVPAFVVGRGVSYGVIRWARRRQLLETPTLILGGGRLGMDLLTTLYEHPEYGLRAVGFLDGGSQLDHREPLGPLTDIEHVLDHYGVRKVIVAFGTTREAELVALVREAAMRDVEIYIVPRFFDVGMAPSGPHVDDLYGVPLYRVRRAALTRGVWRIKRVIDVLVSGAALLLLSPLLAGLAAAVRLSSPGPVLFRQPRTGQFGRDIEILKFRSLRMAPQVAPEDPSPVAAGGTSESTSSEATMAARRSDVESRQTRVGTFIRRTSLDELPQLWNIFRGDMSLVGPRPEERRYAAEFSDSVQGYRDRHRLTVGLTGWAQVHGLRGDTSIQDRARFDNHYIEHWSLWRDIVILLRTLSAVARDAVVSDRRRP